MYFSALLAIGSPSKKRAIPAGGPDGAGSLTSGAAGSGSGSAGGAGGGGGGVGSAAGGSGSGGGGAGGGGGAAAVEAARVFSSAWTCLSSSGACDLVFFASSRTTVLFLAAVGGATIGRPPRSIFVTYCHHRGANMRDAFRSLGQSTG